MNQFAKLLDEYKKTLGFTDEALAEKIQVSKMTVYNWRTGKVEQPCSRQKLLQRKKFSRAKTFSSEMCRHIGTHSQTTAKIYKSRWTFTGEI
ncbi:hypothetical protein PN36_07035 [Candidatus Thiomargarita nelsonii]|uniref:Uncharacterized protein n=1 Tax=Candidatus Thiomargarita nelsonii TaxID=1003181 RepID=A0A0A6P570_9GAMM|nr:hypothetical protein PN36_07035 [Candidatus Thiomargarita nelsonii]